IGQCMGNAVHINVTFSVVTYQRINHRLGLLRGGGVVQINQWLTVNLTGQNRELCAQRSKIQTHLTSIWLNLCRSLSCNQFASGAFGISLISSWIKPKLSMINA